MSEIFEPAPIAEDFRDGKRTVLLSCINKLCYSAENLPSDVENVF